MALTGYAPFQVNREPRLQFKDHGIGLALVYQTPILATNKVLSGSHRPKSILLCSLVKVKSVGCL